MVRLLEYGTEPFCGLMHSEKLGFVLLRPDAHGARFESVSGSFLQMTGLSLDGLPQDFLELVAENNRARLRRMFELRPASETYRETLKLRTASRELWVLGNGTVYERDGQRFAALLLTDISDLKRNESELRHAQERLCFGLRASGICVFEVDIKRQLYTYFENAEGIFGVSGQKILHDVQPFSTLPPDEYQEAAAQYFSHPGDREAVEHAFAQVLRGKRACYEARMRAGESEYVWCRIEATPVLDRGEPVRMVGVISNIHSQRQERERLTRQARQDAFTGLLNKKAAFDAADRMLRQAPYASHALVVLDIDKLKIINDTFGHAAGDEVIRAVAQSLRETFRQSDALGRFGGDEFVVFMNGIGERSAVLRKLEKLMKTKQPYGAQCSVGVAFYPEHGTGIRELFRRADEALYLSKRQRDVCTARDTVAL